MFSKVAIFIFLAAFASQALAVHKCTGVDGKVTFQDIACAPTGEGVDVPKVTPVATESGGEVAAQKSKMAPDDRASGDVRHDRRQALSQAQQKLAMAKQQCPQRPWRIFATIPTASADSQEVAAACDVRLKTLEKEVAATEKACTEVKCRR